MEKIIATITEHIYIIAPALALIVFAILLLKRRVSGETNVAYTQKNDPTAQKIYDSAKSGDKVLTLKERLELSWQFLYEITDIVLNKFSSQDQEATLNIGKTLLENGGRYEHVIDYGIKHNLGRAQSKDGITKGV